jgi:putative membrane protein
MLPPLPYCGSPPSPEELLGRFNLDPVLIGALFAVAAIHYAAGNDRRVRAFAICGWVTAAIAFISPLCALSVALFSARIAQHMILLLVAAPLIALGWPTRRPSGGPAMDSHASVLSERGPLWAAGGVFMLALWGWHMPTPYEATFTSTAVYWTMHITLFGSGIVLWRELLNHPALRIAPVLGVGLLTSMQMGLLGAVLTLAQRPLFYSHLTTTQVWGLTPLQDQQLGGILMWVPGILLFLWAAIRSLRRLWDTLESATRHESDPARLS